jgi:hypothetical protein
VDLTVPAPIIILGNPRSGTTFLHELLVETGCFDYLNLYQVVEYERLDPLSADSADTSEAGELAARMERLGLRCRGFDEVAISPSAPEEYCHVLTNQRGGAILGPWNLHLFEQMCSRLQRDSEGRRPLLLKNPWDYANFPYIAQAVPRARFVFIHRHPERLLQSTLGFWRTLAWMHDPYALLISNLYVRTVASRWRLAMLRALSARRMDVGARLITGFLAYCNQTYVRNIGRLPADRYISLRYEDLCADPAGWRDRVLAFCGVDRAAARLEPVTARPRCGPLSAEVRRWRPVIAQVMRGYMAMQGYCATGRGA